MEIVSSSSVLPSSDPELIRQYASKAFECARKVFKKYYVGVLPIDKMDVDYIETGINNARFVFASVINHIRDKYPYYYHEHGQFYEIRCRCHCQLSVCDFIGALMVIDNDINPLDVNALDVINHRQTIILLNSAIKAKLAIYLIRASSTINNEEINEKCSCDKMQQSCFPAFIQEMITLAKGDLKSLTYKDRADVYTVNLKLMNEVEEKIKVLNELLRYREFINLMVSGGNPFVHEIPENIV